MQEHTLAKSTVVAGPEATVTASQEAGAPVIAGRAVWWRDQNRRLNALAAGVLLLLAFGFMSPGLPPGRVAVEMQRVLIYPPWKAHFPEANPHFGGGDPLLMQLPWHSWLQQELAHGLFPLWDSAPVGGMSMLGSYEVGAFYPLHLLWALLPVGAGYGIIIALKLWLVGLGMWGFLRALRLHPSAAGLSAIALMFSGWTVDFLPWQLTSVYLLLPWMVWAIYAWCRGGSAWWLVALAGLVACMVFAGHPEMMFIVGLTLVWWTLGLALTSAPKQWLRQVGGLAIAVLLGFAVSAFQLFAFIEQLGISYVHAGRAADTGLAGAYLRSDIFIYWALPRHWGYPPDGILGRRTFLDGNAYVGSVALLGLLLTAVAGTQRKLAWRVVGIWTGIGVFAALVLYDGTAGTFIRQFPFFNQSDNARWLSILAFAALVVSAYGWDWFARWVEGRQMAGAIRWGRGAWFGAGVLLLAQGVIIMAVHFAGLLPQPVLTEKTSIWLVVNDDYRRYWAIWEIGVALAVLGATALWAAGGRTRGAAQLILVTVLVLDLWRMFQLVNGTAPASQYYPETSFLQQVKRAMPATGRVVAEGEVLPPNSAMLFGIRDWRAADPMMSMRAWQAARAFGPDFDKSPWSAYNMFFNHVKMSVGPMLGVDYFILPSGTDPNLPDAPDPGRPAFTRLGNADGLGLWRAEGVPGFSYLSDNVQVVAGEAEARDWLQGITWEQARSYAALVEGPSSTVAGISRDPEGKSPGSTDVEEYLPGLITVKANALRPSVLVVAESWSPGWYATIDGRSAELLRANYLSQGVIVPAGKHTVELRYAPDSLKYGLPVSGLGALGLLVLAVVAGRKARRGIEARYRSI